MERVGIEPTSVRLKVWCQASRRPLHTTIYFYSNGGIRTHTVEILSLLPPTFGLRCRLLYSTLSSLLVQPLFYSFLFLMDRGRIELPSRTYKVRALTIRRPVLFRYYTLSLLRLSTTFLLAHLLLLRFLCLILHDALDTT